jgi:hypothetical protein
MDYLAVLWGIKTMCEEEKISYTRRTTYRATRFDQLVTWYGSHRIGLLLVRTGNQGIDIYL